jgi:hypothetical protein
MGGIGLHASIAVDNRMLFLDFLGYTGKTI